jgi:hypothetical protein
MGCSLVWRHEHHLRNHFHEVVLLVEGDKAGCTAGAAIAGRLIPTLSTGIVEVPADSQSELRPKAFPPVFDIAHCKWALSFVLAVHSEFQ